MATVNEALTVMCPKCGVVAGEWCVRVLKKGTTGSQLMHLHKERYSAYEEHIRIDAEHELLYGSASKGVVEKTNNGAVKDLLSREVRVEKVIWAIMFARKIGISNDTILRRLAEMVVDAELDLKLF